MNKKRLFILGLLALVLFALPVSVFANKQLYKARLTTDAELHTVVGSDASGSFILVRRPASLDFMGQIRGLTSAPSGVHLHAAADETQNAPVRVTLCGNPAPAVFPTCDLDANGNLIFSGSIPSTYIQGMTNAEFFNALENGLVYVNAHTSLNPAGETRGQLHPH